MEKNTFLIACEADIKLGFKPLMYQLANVEL